MGCRVEVSSSDKLEDRIWKGIRISVAGDENRPPSRFVGMCSRHSKAREEDQTLQSADLFIRLQLVTGLSSCGWWVEYDDVVKERNQGAMGLIVECINPAGAFCIAYLVLVRELNIHIWLTRSRGSIAILEHTDKMSFHYDH